MSPPTSEVRPDVRGAHRVVVKIGSSSLTDPAGHLDHDRLDELVGIFAERRLAGTDIIVVTSGAIASALGVLSLRARPRDLATQQAAAAVGQGLLLAKYTSAFGAHGLVVGQVLLSADDLVRRTHYRNAHRTVERLLAMGVVPVVNENDTVATAEIRFGDNDRLAALVAQAVRAEALILLSDVPGLFTAPPDHPEAELIPTVRTGEDLGAVRIGATGRVGSGGMTTKIEAARIASIAGIPTVLAEAGQARDALAGQPVGTHFHAAERRAPTRLLWLAHAATPLGSVTLDDGAVHAVVQRRASLLPAGITKVEGAFVAGDPIELRDSAGTAVARGLVNFDAAELPGLLGRSTRDLARELGPAYEREVIHRDDLVVLEP